MDEIAKKWRSLKHRSLKNGYPYCSKDEFRVWFNGQTKKCRYCGIDEAFLAQYCTRIPATASLHIDRVINTEGYVTDNLVLACYNCNSIIKRTRTPKFVIVVVDAIIENGLLDEYHLWNVPLDLRIEACMWDQFRSGNISRKGNQIVYDCVMPNALHYLPQKFVE